MTLRKALDRTLRLMRDEFGSEVSDETLIDALTGTSVALVADDANLSTHSAQTAFVTAAMLMARSGHRVTLLAPNVRLVGAQPPLCRGRLIDGLLEIGTDILPDVEFALEPPAHGFDLAVGVGNSAISAVTRRTIRINADPWAGMIQRANLSLPWSGGAWPFGGLAAAGLAAGEAFKIAMPRLLPFALNPTMTAAVFAEATGVTFQLAPSETGFAAQLGELDCVSAGAITNAALYCLARIPNVSARGRIIEPDTAAVDNLNRYMLLRRSRAECEAPKAKDLARQLADSNLHFLPVAERFEGPGRARFATNVLVGVDDIPTRWNVQRARPEFLAIGATTHWSAMSSFHTGEGGCAQCLHPDDDPTTDPIPTTAVVSFWAGLLTAAYIARRAAGETMSSLEQQIFVTPFRLEKPYRAPVPTRPGCPSCR